MTVSTSQAREDQRLAELAALREQVETLKRDIAQRIEADAAMRRSEARFRALTERSSDVTTLRNSKGQVIYLSPSIAQLVGWTPQEMVGSEYDRYVYPPDHERVATMREQLVHGASELALEFRAVHRDGSIRWVEATGRNLCADPNIGAIVTNLRDITERVQAQQTSLENLRRLEEAQAIAHVGSWTSDLLPDGNIQWSRECYRIFGVAEGTPMTVESFFAHVHSDDLERVQTASRDASDRNVPYDIAHQIVRSDGTVRWVHERAFIERDAAGHPTRMSGTVQDITDRQLATEALRTSEAEFRLLAESMPQIVWIARPDGANIYLNEHWIRYTGATLADSLGHGWLVPFHPDDRPRASLAWENAIANDQTIAVDCRLRRADGVYRWWLMRGVPVRDAAGTILKWFGTCTDIDALKQGEERLRESEALLRITGRAARLGGWSVSLPDQGVTWSDEVCNILELPPGMAPSLERALEYYAPEFRESIQQKMGACARDGAPFDVELQVITETGRRVWVRAIGYAERSASGAITMLRGAFQDIDDRRKLQDQYRQAQKMEAVGRLAGGVAHDFNNLLSVILSYAEFALDALKVGDPLRDDIEEIRKAGNRASSLTRQLLAFSRQQVLAPRVIDLNEIVDSMRPMLARLLGEDVNLTVVPSPQRVGRTLVDPTQVEQVLMNLAVNARDAMPNGGKLSLETADVLIDDAFVGKPTEILAGWFVMLAVKDNGEGMSESTRSRAFEPFFTTKATGKGTGLGLATVFGIVQQSGGFVTVHSEPGLGTTFKLYFPRTNRAAEPVISQAPSSAELGGTETILLVEDETQVRGAACAILRRHGYIVLETSNGGEAFLVSNDFTGRIHLLLTDVVMPRVSGRRLAEQLAPLRPDMKVLFTSGYTDDTIIHHGVLEAGVSFLQKPFTPQALLKKVRDVLDADRRRDSALLPA